MAKNIFPYYHYGRLAFTPASVESCGIKYTNSYTNLRFHNDSTLIPQ
jgi:hypothetical protein